MVPERQLIALLASLPEEVDAPRMLPQLLMGALARMNVELPSRRDLVMWLYRLDPDLVPDRARSLMEQFRDECDEVLSSSGRVQKAVQDLLAAADRYHAEKN
jgi:hypothetical protein